MKAMVKKLKVAVLMGGPSHEHDVSLKTGRNVLINLDKEKYEVLPVVVEKTGEWEMWPATLRHRADVVFVAMHGPYGEDGTVQSELDTYNIPYTGSDAHSSALGMNKHLSLRLLQDAGLAVPQTFHLSRMEWLENPKIMAGQIEHLIGAPLVLKPNRSGSSLDTVIIRAIGGIGNVLSWLFKKHDDLIAQPYIEGREFTCGVLDWGLDGSAYPLLPTEIIPRAGDFFDYDSKYKVGGADEITPARLSDSWSQYLRQTACRAHNILGCKGMSRTDFMLSKENTRQLYILEVNTIPGMTKTSLLPKAAEGMGIPFSKLLDRVIKAALT